MNKQTDTTNPSTFLPITEREKRQGFYNLPTSPAADLLVKTMGAREDVNELYQYRKPGSTIAVQSSGKARRIDVENTAGNVMIELSSVDKVIGNRKGVKKMFLYALTQINEQAYSVENGVGVLRSDSITFTLQDLQDAGLYSTNDTARRGFTRARDAFTSMKVMGKQKRGKKSAATIDALEVLFTGGKIKNNICTLYLNDRINWGFICSYYTLLPKWAFSLPINAFDMLYTIFFLARQNTSKIQQQGYFTISIETIRKRLGLPPLETTRRLKESIMQPIEDAITNIEDTRMAIEQAGQDFTITPSPQENTRDFLENGYLKIGLAGNYASSFIDIAQGKTEAIEAKKKKQEKAKQKALIELYQEQLKKAAEEQKAELEKKLAEAEAEYKKLE